jgi:hypothetical protein
MLRFLSATLQGDPLQAWANDELDRVNREIQTIERLKQELSDTNVKLAKSNRDLIAAIADRERARHESETVRTKSQKLVAELSKTSRETEAKSEQLQEELRLAQGQAADRSASIELGRGVAVRLGHKVFRCRPGTVRPVEANEQDDRTACQVGVRDGLVRSLSLDSTGTTMKFRVSTSPFLSGPYDVIIVTEKATGKVEKKRATVDCVCDAE